MPYLTVPFLKLGQSKPRRQQCADSSAERTSTALLALPFSKYSPDTHLPLSLDFCAQSSGPLISLQAVQDHLVLLRAFFALGQRDDFPHLCERAAVAYLEYARGSASSGPREENAKGGEGVKEEEEDKEAEVEGGPLEVLMCWHAHMLNPIIYKEDTDGVYSALKGISFPLRELAERITSDVPFPPLPLSPEVDAPVSTGRRFDVAAATQRQAKFIVKMYEIGWLEPSKFEENITELQRAIVRYRQRFPGCCNNEELMPSTGRMVGLDVLYPIKDLPRPDAGHRSCVAYPSTDGWNDTERLLGRVLDHDDDAGGRKVDDGFVRTGELWKARFGFEY
ncbi:hypothetical protein P7C73_g3633, partial [Tremellales sp. Uapishka_1]